MMTSRDICFLLATAFVTNAIGSLKVTPAYFNCVFPDPVDCVWLRNGTAVSIDGRYSYYKGDGTNTTDCSLRVRQPLLGDRGQWTCTYYANERGRGAPAEKTVTLGDEVEHLRTESPMVIETPSNTIVSLGQRVRLNCTFTKQVSTCLWLRGGHVIHLPATNIGYVHQDAGRMTVDCSIELKEVRPVDIAAWQCSFIASHPQKASSSQSAWIYSKDVAFVEVKVGDDVQLNCSFPRMIEQCVWHRNGHQVRISSRLRFTRSKNGFVTDNCSVHVTEIRHVDLGLWECSAVVNNYHGFTRVSRVILSSPAPTIKIPPPKHLPIQVGLTVELPCLFSDRVWCTWYKNGGAVHVGYRWSYVKDDGKNTSDCSLRISQLDARDEGRWRCGSLAEDGRTETLSREVNLTIEHPMADLKLSFSDGVRRVTAEAVVNIPCIFNHAVGCAWYHNGRIVKTQSALMYRQENSGATATDCSLTILTAQPDDKGIWSCGNLLDDSNGPTVRGEVVLEIETDKVIDTLVLTFAVVGAIGVSIIIALLGVIRMRSKRKAHNNYRWTLKTDKLTGQIRVHNIYKATPGDKRKQMKRGLPDTPKHASSQQDLSSVLRLLPEAPSAPMPEDENTDADGYIRVHHNADPETLHEHTYEDPNLLLALPTRRQTPPGTIARLASSMRRYAMTSSSSTGKPSAGGQDFESS